MKRNRAGLVLALACVVFGVVYFFVDPARCQWMPKCAFFQLTGLKCAGCGTQRALHALLTGDFGEAWAQNPFMILLLPVILFLVWLEFRRNAHADLYRKVHTPFNILLFGVLVIAWTIGRNFL